MSGPKFRRLPETIYALHDPTGAIRYVGRTERPLKAPPGFARVSVIERLPEPDYGNPTRKAWWIEFMRAAGCELLNAHY